MKYLENFALNYSVELLFNENPVFENLMRILQMAQPRAEALQLLLSTLTNTHFTHLHCKDKTTRVTLYISSIVSLLTRFFTGFSVEATSLTVKRR